jgi:hypothetical protein
MADKKYCQNCGKELVSGNKVLSGKYEGWCVKCSMDIVTEERYKNHSKHWTIEERNAYVAAADTYKRPETKDSWEYKAAQLKAVGSALTPIGAITGWGQGDLKRLNAEKRQKDKMDELIAAVKAGQQEEALTYCSQCNVGNPLAAKFCNNCGSKISGQLTASQRRYNAKLDEVIAEVKGDGADRR